MPTLSIRLATKYVAGLMLTVLPGTPTFALLGSPLAMFALTNSTQFDFPQTVFVVFDAGEPEFDFGGQQHQRDTLRLNLGPNFIRGINYASKQETRDWQSNHCSRNHA
jgi:hypothetical protein